VQEIGFANFDHCFLEMVLTPFSKKIETDIKAWGFIVVEISGFAKQLRLAKKGDVIFNTVLSEMVLIS
ncbi:MAG: hypothetical protein ACE5DU_09075, partial [Nitrosopumilus sp.]